MGFWYPVSKDGYHAPTPVNIPSNVIFHFEALCMLSALDHVQTKAPKGSKILIYVDNEKYSQHFSILEMSAGVQPSLEISNRHSHQK